MSNDKIQDRTHVLIGRNVKRLRTILNFSKEELGVAVDLSEFAIGNIEGGHATTVNRLIMLAKVLGV